MMGDKYAVQIADMKLAQRNGTLITYALGSCVGVCIYDPAIKLAGLLHVILPTSSTAREPFPYKFADTGVVEMLRQMAKHGGAKRNYICKIAGGAKMFTAQNSSFLGNIGQRNIEVVKQTLIREGVRISGEDTGGSVARTMSIEVPTGEVYVRSIGKTQRLI